MKKLSFLAGALLIGGVAFAQSNTSTTTQNGDNNDADVEQTGASNSIIIDQNQTGGSAQSGMDADVIQNGTGNTGTINQDAVRQSRAKLDQAGATNQAQIDQLDYANDANVKQNGTGNEAIAFQANGRFMLSDIEQTGDGNFAETDQSKGAASGVTRAQALITQSGDDNEAYIRQDAYQRASATIDQFSSDNDADIEQYSVVQLVNNHVASITQQTGDLNEASIYQSGGSGDGLQHIATIIQDGAANFTDLDQTGDGHVATMNFLGNDNNFTATQSGNAPALVVGTGNTIDLIVIGNDNDGLLTQDGSSNMADLDITGDSNLMNVSQSGDGHSATETINGSGNTINVIQN